MKQIFTGQIIRLKNKNTATVKIVYNQLHPKFHKPLKKTVNKQVHYEEKDNGLVEIGKKVIITSCEPISKTKKFIISKFI